MNFFNKDFNESKFIDNKENSILLISHNQKAKYNLLNNFTIQFGFLAYTLMLGFYNYDFDISHLAIVYLLINIFYFFYVFFYVSFCIEKYLFTNTIKYFISQSLSIIFIFSIFIIFFTSTPIFPKNYHIFSVFIVTYCSLLSITISGWANLSFLYNALITFGYFNNKNISSKLINKVIIDQQQINPHFLANALGTLQTTIKEGNIEEAINYNSQLFLLFSKQINYSSKEYITIEEEIEWLKLYLEIEKSRISENIEYTIIIDDSDIVLHEISPNLLQPIIENCINHGFHKNLDRLFKIELSFKEIDNNGLKIIISDNGRGSTKNNLNTKVGHSFALNNINGRIQTLNAIGKYLITFTQVFHENGSNSEIIIREKSL